MKRIYSIVIPVVVILIIAIAAARAGNAVKITVAQTADKITITGDKCKKIVSDKFALSKDGWYIIKISYTGPKVSICQLSLVDQKMIAEKMTVGGMLTNWMGPNTTETVRSKGSAKSEDYMIYVDEVGGPWTVEILKNPKPTPVSSESTFSDAKNKVTAFFHLKKGPAKFTMNQKLQNQFSSRLNVTLINADTGEFITNLCHNDTSPTQTVTKDIPVAGNYILEVSGGGTWNISYTQ